MRVSLIALSGAREEILDRCPTERIKFQSLGWAILITSGLATVSMWFALTSAMGLNPVLALPIALLWGLVIMGIDRWLVTSMPIGGTRRWTIAIPRLVLALLLGSLISTPIVLRIFQSEINAQISLIREQRASAFLAAQLHSPVNQQVVFWRKDVANLQKVIDSGGLVALNPSSDPQVQSLTKQRTTELKLEHQFYEQWQCQLYGGQGCTVKGNGPLAQASKNSYDQAAADVATLTGAIQSRDRQLAATDTASKRARLNQARTALPSAQQQLAAATARQTALQQGFDAQNESLNGLLIRLEALDQLSGKNFTVNTARLLLFLLFLVIECLPVTVKLMQQPGPYEELLQTAAAEDLKAGKRAYRSQAWSLPGAAGPVRGGDTRMLTGDDALTADLHQIWQTTPASAWAEPPKKEPSHMAADHAAGPGVYDEQYERDDKALRGLKDTRVAADADRHASGIDRLYGADDL